MQAGPAATPPPIPALQKKIDFETSVLPIFKRNCLACHNAADQKGDLVLETPQHIQKGGKSGPVVDSKNAMESLLLTTSAKLEKPFMPPKNNKVGAELLKPEELSILRTWIEQGATGMVRAKPRPLTWKPLPPGLHPISALAVTPDGQFAACGRANQIFIYHTPTGQVVARLTDPKLAENTGRSGYHSAAQRDFVQSLAFSPDGLLLASGEFRQVKLWQREPNLPQFSLGKEPTGVVAVSPDGKIIATAEGSAIHLWQSFDGQPYVPCLACLGHTARVTSLHFSADSARILSGSADKTVRIWDVHYRSPDGGAVKKTPTIRSPFAQVELPQEVKAVAWLFDGKQVAAADGESIIHLWELPEKGGEPMKSLKDITGHTGPVTCLEPILDGHQLLSGSEDKTVKHWAIDQGNRMIKSMDASGPVTALAASPDGKNIAAASGNVARIWTGDQRKVAADIKGDHRALAAEAKAMREADFATREVAYWKTALETATKAQPTRADAVKKATDALKAAETAVKDKLAAVEKAADEKAKATVAEEAHKAETARGAAKVALAAAQDLLKQADQSLADGKASSEKAAAAVLTTKAAVEQAHKAVTEGEKPVRTLAFAPNGLALATAGDSGAVQTWSAETGAGFDTFPGDIGAVDAVAYTPDGRLVSATAKKPAVVWRSGPAWTLARTIGTGDEKSPLVSRVLALDFSPDGKWIATGGGAPSRNGEVKIWKAADGSLVREITPSHSDSVYGLDFSPDGKLLATASADKFVKIFDATTGKLVKPLSGHTHYVLGVSWRADGRMLASCGADKVVKLWSYPAGEQLKTVEGFQKEVTSVRFVGLGNELLTTSGDTKVRLLKDDGSTARDFGGSKGFILAAAVTPDGQVVLGGGQDSILRIWNGPTAKTLFTLDPPATEVAVKGAPAAATPKPAK